MSVLVRDAVYEPVRKFQNSQYFLKILENGKMMYMPVSDAEVKLIPNKSDLVKLSYLDIKGEELKVPDVNVVNKTLLNFQINIILE